MKRVPYPEERRGEDDAKDLGLATGVLSSLDDAQHPQRREEEKGMHVALEIMGGAGEERAEHKQEEAPMMMCRVRSGQSGSLLTLAADENARLMSAQLETRPAG